MHNVVSRHLRVNEKQPIVRVRSSQVYSIPQGEVLKPTVQVVEMVTF
jgi:hypothetical protein